MDSLLRFFSRPQPPIPPPVLKIELTTRPIITPRAQFELSPERQIYQAVAHPSEQLYVRYNWLNSNVSKPMPEITVHINLDGESIQTLRKLPSNSSASQGGRGRVQHHILPSQIDAPGGVALTIPFGPEASTRTETPEPAPLTPLSSSSKIPKPVGEPGRPGSGGFNLELTLRNTYNWSQADVKALLVYLRKEATRTLSMNHSFRSQKKEAIDRMCDKAMDAEHWPVLADYDDCWPVRSALKLILKYKSEASRRNADKTTLDRVRDAVSGSSGARGNATHYNDMCDR